MRLALDYAGHRLALGPLDDDALFKFLAAYFVPYFDFVETDAGRGAFARLHVHVAQPPAAAPDFTDGSPTDVDRSGGFLRCRGVVVDDGPLRWVRLEPFAAVVRIDRARHAVDVWGHSADALRIPVLRLVEDLVLNEVQRAGAIVIHASAVVAGGRAVLAVGNKKAGKTTILCRLLSAFDVTKMANDNVCLFEQDGAVVARGWPAFFKIAAATVAAHTELAADFPAAERPQLDDDETLWSVYEKVALFPAQGAARFGASVTPEAPVGCLVLPVFDPQRPPGLSDVPPDRLIEELPAYLQGVRNPNHPEWVGLNPVSDTLVARRAREIAGVLTASGIPMVRLQWAPSLDDLLARLPTVRPTKRSLKAAAAGIARADVAWPPLPTTGAGLPTARGQG